MKYASLYLQHQVTRSNMYGCDSEDNPHTPSPLKQKHDVQFLIITCLGFLLQLHYKLVKGYGMLIIRKNEGNRAVNASNNHQSKPLDTRLSFA